MVPQTKVFVGSLSQGSKPEELRQLFERFGVVTECDIMNRCGFVHMQTEDQAAAAIRALHNTTFNGSVITVERGRIKERGQRGGGRGGGMRGGGMRNGMDRRGGGGGGPMRGGSMGARDAPYMRDRGMGGGHMRGGDMRGSMGGGGSMGYERPIERQMGAGGYAEDRYNNYGEDRRGFVMDGRGARGDPYAAPAPMYDDRRSYAAPIDPLPPMYDDRRAMYPDERDMMERRPMRGGPMMSAGYDRQPKPAPMGNGADMYSRRSPMRGAAVGGYDRDPYAPPYNPMPRKRGWG